MEIKEFLVEKWLNTYEEDAQYNTAETCVDSVSLNQLFEMLGNKEEILNKITNTRLTYGHIYGKPELKQNIATLYEKMTEKNIITTNGAIGANFLSLYSLVDPGDEVISVYPIYQQMYSIPESFGAKVKLLLLKPENNFLPDIGELKSMVTEKTKLICINNPNNPCGSLMEEGMLKEIIDIAKNADAYIHSDEVYRGLYQENDIKIPSVADLYEKGISIGSMSKVFSLAGIRVGWLAANENVIDEVAKRRDYNIISCGILDEIIANYVLDKKEIILKRNHNIIKENLIILDNWVKNEPRVSYVKPRAGTTAFVKYHLDIPSIDFCKGLFKNKSVLIVPGKAFDVEGFFRLSYAYDKEQLKIGLKLISEYMDELEK